MKNINHQVPVLLDPMLSGFSKYPQYQIFNLDALTYAGNLENIVDIEKPIILLRRYCWCAIYWCFVCRTSVWWCFAFSLRVSSCGSFYYGSIVFCKNKWIGTMNYWMRLNYLEDNMETFLPHQYRWGLWKFRCWRFVYRDNSYDPIHHIQLQKFRSFCSFMVKLMVCLMFWPIVLITTDLFIFWKNWFRCLSIIFKTNLCLFMVMENILWLAFCKDHAGNWFGFSWRV
jgi:hypothetical protein